MVEVKKGDVFCTHGVGFLSNSIRGIEKFWSKDNEATYSHAGIILDSKGSTLEALSDGIKRKNIFEYYKNIEVLIVRPNNTNSNKIELALAKIIRDHENKSYPWWVLGLHLFPPLTKFRPADMLVCSELVAEYLWRAECRHSNYLGTTPDNLADEFLNYKNYEVMFQDRLK